MLKITSIRTKNIFLVLIITGAYWYRLFQVGDGVLGNLRLFQIICILGLLYVVLSSDFKIKIQRKILCNNMPVITLQLYSLILLYSMVMSVFAYSQKAVFLALYEYFFMALIMILIPQLVKDNEDMLFCSKICLCNIVVMCFLAIVEMISGKYILGLTTSTSVLSWEYFGMHSPIVQYNHPNNLAMAMLLSLPLCRIVLKRNKQYPLIYGGLLIIFGIIFLAANARLSIIVMAFYVCMSFLHEQKKKRKIIYCIMLIIFILFLAYIFLDESSFDVSGVMKNARVKIWIHSLNNLILSDGLGVGLGNSSIVNQVTATASYIGRPCHNFWVEVFMETGIFGGTIWTLWFILLLRNVYINRKRSVYSWECFCIVVLFAPMMIQQSSLMGAMTIWMIMGVVISSCQESIKTDEIRIVEERK